MIKTFQHFNSNKYLYVNLRKKYKAQSLLFIFYIRLDRANQDAATKINFINFTKLLWEVTKIHNSNFL